MACGAFIVPCTTLLTRLTPGRRDSDASAPAATVTVTVTVSVTVIGTPATAMKYMYTVTAVDTISLPAVIRKHVSTQQENSQQQKSDSTATYS